MQTLVIGVPVVKANDGASIAQELQRTLAVIGVESSVQVASFSADGQYHYEPVGQKLTDALNENAGE